MHEWCCRHTASEVPVLLMQRQEMKRLSMTAFFCKTLSIEFQPNLINTVNMSRQRCFTSRWPTSKTVSPLLSAPPLTPLVTILINQGFGNYYD